MKTTYQLLLLAASLHLSAVAQEPRFRFDGNPLGFRPPPAPAAEEDAGPTTPAPSSPERLNSSLVWQPLRATFRPLNRQSPPSPPPPPLPPQPPLDSSAASELAGDAPPTSRLPFPSAGQPTWGPATSSGSSTTTTLPPPTRPATASLDEEDQPTRVPLSRFRPTRAPSMESRAPPPTGVFAPPAASGSDATGGGSPNATHYRMTQDCFECICEAATNCNANSRCQTSDVRHTRCGLFLISYEQWTDSQLSRELVSREALARDAAADERAFYECVTSRDCSERLLSVYMAKQGRDCDRDGRVDCYDLAAIHQAGAEHCAGESLLESQYWSDFNACFGFGR